MKKRIITGAVLIALCIPIGIYSGTLALPIVVAALSMIGIFEMYRCIGLSGRLPVLLPALLIGGGMPMLAFFLRQQTMRFFMCLIPFFRVTNPVSVLSITQKCEKGM